MKIYPLSQIGVRGEDNIEKKLKEKSIKKENSKKLKFMNGFLVY